MGMISFLEFQKRAEEYNVVPLERTLLADLLTPVSTYLTIRKEGVPSFLFESVEPDERVGRFSFIGVAPSVLVRARGGEVTIQAGSEQHLEQGNLFDILQRLTGKFRQAPTPGNVFSGGFVGYIGYNCVSHIEDIRLSESDSTGEDDAMLGLFEGVIRFDHRNQVVQVTVNVIVDTSRPLQQQYESGKQRLDAIVLRLRNSIVASRSFSCDASAVREQRDEAAYCESVLRAKRHIKDGDIFQVVLSRRVQLPFGGDPFPIYRAIRIINPSPYLFFLDFGETRLIGSSPEVLVRSLGETVELFPIAGTRRRGRSPEEDAELENELLNDEKELAEHLMLVDLGRNDIGRIAEYGTVDVPVFKRVERYSHVMHLVSEVRGQLQRGKGPIDVLRACFPAGTVTGAPKIRAMEIIDELEQKRRGMYAGAVGYIGFNGSLDTCIAIRTVLAHADLLSVQAGAGVVADSVPELEYKETVNKAKALIEAIRLAANDLQV